jgi:hypothetical protein
MRRISVVLAALAMPAMSFAWTAPIGVPAPAFPTDLDVARPTLPSPWSAETAGFYYVSKTSCSDSRAQGTPSAPRCSLPSSVSAGAVIVISGTYGDEENISYRGTAADPVWIMGADPSNKPTLTNLWSFNGSYIIADSLKWQLNTRDSVGLDGDHLMLRNSDMANSYGAANGANFYTAGSFTVFYKNVVSQAGNWQHSGADIDRQGIKVTGGTSDLWIVDSQFYHCQSDGVQVGDQNNASSAINRVYIARNIAYENLQFGFWTKNATDVVFSENTIYNQSRSTASGPGGGVGGQYDPRYVWFIANHIYNSNTGIHVASTSNGGGGPWYAIGNVIHNISSGGDCNAYNAGAISFRNDGGFTVLFNTIHDVDFFVGFPPSGGSVVVRNNIFSAKKGGSCSAMVLEKSITHDYNLFSSSTYNPGGESNPVIGNPLFVTLGQVFAILTGSPAINKANPTEEAAMAAYQTRYGVDIRRDLNGVRRPQNSRWDIGAYESDANVISPSPPSNLRAN